MEKLRKHWLPLVAVVLVLVAAVAWANWPSAASAAEASLSAPVKYGDFKVIVTTTGELRARKFVQVSGPGGAQSVQVYQTKISSIVPEGSLVKEGDVIAELDKQPVAAKIADVTLALQKAQADFTTAQLDSALEPGPGAGRRTQRRRSRSRRRSSRASRRSMRRRRSGGRRRSIYEKAQRALDAVEAEPAHQDQAGDREDVVRRRRPRPPAEQPQEPAARTGQLLGARSRSRDGDLRARVERQEEGRRFAVERVGVDGRHAAGSHADGVGHLRQRSGRPEARRSGRKCRSRSTRIRRRGSPGRSRTSRTSASSGRTRTPRCSRSRSRSQRPTPRCGPA